jgi:CheY-like chemotaxis protein
MEKILCVEEVDTRDAWVRDELKEKGYEVIFVNTKEEVIDAVQSSRPFDLAIVGMRMIGDSRGGLEVIREIRTKDPFTEIIVLTASGTLKNVYQGMKFCIWQYIFFLQKTG